MARGQKTLKISADLDRIIAETGISQRAALNKFAQELALEVVSSTPVDTGRLRASWFPARTLTTPAQSVAASEVSPGAQGRVLARLSQEVDASIGDGDGTFYFLNGANYAIFVEARRAFVKTAVSRSRAIMDRAIANVKAIRGGR